MPLPGSFVVKNGSKMRAFVSASMPQPVSVHRRASTYRPAAAIPALSARLSSTMDVGGAHGQRAAARHGVARVHAEIDEHLLELASGPP